MRFASERLAEARLTLELTQEDLAKAVGIDVRTYRRYESGEVNGGGFDVRRADRRRIVERLGAELGLSVEELLAGDAASGPHALPPTPGFVGRAELLADLRAWLTGDLDPIRVVALVAMGGAGKTAIAAQLADGAFVWSFYQDPQAEGALEALLVRLGETATGSGSRADRVEAALRRAAPLLLVLDGLEIVQADGSGDRSAGELEDPPLRRLLGAIAGGVGRARALVTSRRPLADLERWPSVRAIAVPPLTEPEATEVLAGAGVADAGDAARWVGGHALSVALAGSWLRATGGTARDLPDLDPSSAGREDPLARRLVGVLERLVAALDPEERAVFAALSIFPSGATAEALGGLPIGGSARLSAPRMTRILARLIRVGLVQVGAGGRRVLHPLVARYAATLLADRTALDEAERRRLAETLGERLRPTDSDGLDQVEALIRHTIGAGRVDEARFLYGRALGGFDHLGLVLGEMARGARVTRSLVGVGADDRAGVRIRYEAGLYALALGDATGARLAFGAVAAWARADGDLVWGTTVQRATAYAARAAGDLDPALASADAAIRLAEALDDRPHVVRGIALRAAVLHDLGDREAARAEFERVRALGDDPLERRGLWEAEHLVDCGELDLARERTLRNLDRCAARGWPGHVAHAHAVLGAIDARRGDREAGQVHLAALRTWTDHSGEVELVLRGWLLAAELGAPDAAATGAELASRLGFGGILGRFAAIG